MSAFGAQLSQQKIGVLASYVAEASRAVTGEKSYIEFV